MTQDRSNVQVRLLGPFACTRDGESLAIAGRLRCLLAVLAMGADTTVSLERLVDGVWADEPPADPRRALQVYVNRLRGRLGADAIRTQHSGYRLAVDPDNVDALRFLKLADQVSKAATTADGLALIDRALAEWEGDPFEGVPSEPLEQIEAPRLIERWLGLVEQRLDLRIASGCDAEDLEPLLADLNALTRRFPLRESLWERLLMVLSALGRDAEALERYEEIRSHLVDELGTDPGGGLRAQYERLLRGDHQVNQAPQQLLPDLPQFTGRGDVLAQLDEALLDTDTPAIVTLTGLGGAGKTTIATHWAHQHRDRFPDGQLHIDLRGFSSQEPMEPLQALETLLRTLGIAPEVMPRGVTERSALLRTELSNRQALLVLDNALNVDQVRPLLPGSSTYTIITSRNQLRGLGTHHGARPIAIEPFDETDAVALLSSTVGEARVQAEPDAAREIVTLCGRLPLAIAVTAERATRVPGGSLADIATDLRDERQRLSHLSVGGDGSSDLRAVFGLSDRLLKTSTARMFRLLGLLPDGPFERDVAAVLAGVSVPEATAMLDELVASHLVQQPGWTRYSLHDLLRAYAAERCADEIDAEDADRAVAAVCGWLLETLDAARAVVRPGQPSLGRPATAPADRHRPDPARFTGFADAIDWFLEHRGMLLGWVLRAIERGMDDYVWRLAVPLSWMMDVTEDRVGTADLADIVAPSLARLQDPVAEYVVADFSGRAYARMRRIDEATAAIDRALRIARELGHRQAEAAIIGNLGFMRRIAGDTEEGLRLQKDAYDRTGEADASLLEVAEAAILINIGSCYYELYNFDEAITAMRSALRVADESGDLWRQAICLNNLTVMLELTRDYAAARECFERSQRLADQLRAPALFFNALTAHGRMLVIEGDRDGAARVWEDALALLPATNHPHRLEVLRLLEKVRGEAAA